MAAGTGDGVVSLFHRKEKLLWKRKLGSKVNRVRISARGRYLAVATEDGHLHMFNTTEFLLKHKSTSHHGLDESKEIVFAKPQRIVKKPGTVAKAEAAGSGQVEMGRTTVVSQEPRAAARTTARSKVVPSQFAIGRWGLIMLIGLIMVLVVALSVLPTMESPFISFEAGILFIILLSFVILVTLLTKE